MRVVIVLVAAALAGAAAAPAALADMKAPIDASVASPMLDPGYRRPDLVQSRSEAESQAAAMASAGTLKTLAHWQGSFSIAGKAYSFTLLGADPATGAGTRIPTLLVPIRLTVSDYSVDGKTPIVFDGSKVVRKVLDSPIFHSSVYGSGRGQFADAMLRAEFPAAAAGWRLTLVPKVAPVLEIVAPPGTVTVFKSRSGDLLAVVNDDSIIDGPIFKALGAKGSDYDKYVVFISANALEHDAFGYHFAAFEARRSEEHVFAYSSWLEGVADLFTIPSPDAATLSHEVAETVHDAFLGPLTSATLLWGDPFDHNRCFQKFIEVGDAIEDAPKAVQLYRQPVLIGGTFRTYTLQNEALLPWFERQSPSSAMSGAYSFPSLTALTSPAPLTCS